MQLRDRRQIRTAGRALIALVFALTPAPVLNGDEGLSLRVRAPVAEIKGTVNGWQRVIGTVKRSTGLWASQDNGDYFRVRLPSNGEDGWIRKQDVTVVDISETTGAELSQVLKRFSEARGASQFDVAIKLLQGIREKVVDEIGEINPVVANLYYFSAQTVRQAGDFAEAIVHMQKAADIYRAVNGERSDGFADAIEQLGLFHATKKNFRQAELVLKQAVRIRRELYGVEHPLYAKSHESLGDIYFRAGQIVQADRAYSECLRIRRATIKPSDPEYAESLKDVAQVRMMQGDYPRAELLYNELLETVENAPSANDADIATVYVELASLYNKMGKFQRSRHLLQRALEIRKAAYGSEHPLVAEIQILMGQIERKLGNNLEAIQHYQVALDALEKAFGKGHPRTTTPLNNIALMMLDGGNAARARDILIQTVEIERRTWGEEHFQYGVSLNNLAGAYENNGEIYSAIQTYQKALDVYRKALNPNHPDVIATGSNLAFLQFAQNRVGDAMNTMSDVRKAVSNHVPVVLPFLTQQKQLDYLKNLGGARLDTALRQGVRFESVQKQSAEWLINGKYLSGESLAESRRFLRGLSKSSNSQLVTQLNRIREKHATLAMMSVSDAPSLAYQSAMKRLADEEERLLLQMSNIRQAATDTDSRYVSHDRVAAALPQDAVFVDIARLPEFRKKLRLSREAPATEDVVSDENPRPRESNSDLDDAAAEYVAWLTFPSGRVSVVELGNADEIDSLVAAVRDEIAGAVAEGGVLRQEGEVVATQAVMGPLRSLADAVWVPLAEEIGEAKRIFLSPDGALWLTPWNALPVSTDNTYLIEKVQIQYVTSGRDLTRPKKDVAHGPPVVFANPSFDSASGEEDSHSEFTDGIDENFEATLREFSGRRLVSKVAPLPATESEAIASVRGIVSYTKAKPQLHLREKAIEATAKTLRSPQLLSFATHGFFLPTESDSDPADGEGTFKSASNPMLRCGILLAGCNREHNALEANDGVLTGLEISELDLSGTDLVVLSACETGVGDVRIGEGVAGLRQAFQLAGAKAVVASLWSVADGETARLMQLFFDSLAKGLSRSEALREAQLARIRARRERHGAAHPFFWAAMTYTGRDFGTSEYAKPTLTHGDKQIVSEPQRQLGEPGNPTAGKSMMGNPVTESLNDLPSSHPEGHGGNIRVSNTADDFAVRVRLAENANSKWTLLEPGKAEVFMTKESPVRLEYYSSDRFLILSGDAEVQLSRVEGSWTATENELSASSLSPTFVAEANGAKPQTASTPKLRMEEPTEPRGDGAFSVVVRNASDSFPVRFKTSIESKWRTLEPLEIHQFQTDTFPVSVYYYSEQRQILLRARRDSLITLVRENSNWTGSESALVDKESQLENWKRETRGAKAKRNGENLMKTLRGFFGN